MGTQIKKEEERPRKKRVNLFVFQFQSAAASAVASYLLVRFSPFKGCLPTFEEVLTQKNAASPRAIKRKQLRSFRVRGKIT